MDEKMLEELTARIGGMIFVQRDNRTCRCL